MLEKTGLPMACEQLDVLGMVFEKGASHKEGRVLLAGRALTPDERGWQDRPFPVRKLFQDEMEMPLLGDVPGCSSCCS
jgi:hypothetical protein